MPRTSSVARARFSATPVNVAVAVTRRLGPSDERFGAELLELRKRVLEQAMSVLELPAAGMT